MAHKSFEEERRLRVTSNKTDALLADASRQFIHESIRARYSYNFEWLGRPIIQYPPDIVAVQELLWTLRPDLVIETGVAHGGSLILSASMLALLDYCDAIGRGGLFDPRASARRVVGIDIDIRSHNRQAIERHPLAHKIHLIEGSSVAPEVVAEVRNRAQSSRCTVVFLDSNHTHDHVLAELRAYAPMVSVGSYCVVFDTVVERLPGELYPNRPWAPGNSPMTAMAAYLEELEAEASKGGPAFEVDHAIDAKLMISVAPQGYLRRTR